MRELGFIDEMKNEIILVDDPLFSREAVGQYNEKLKKPIRWKFHTSAITGTGKCPICNKNHGIEECATFLAQTMEDRGKILDKRKLCYASLSEISKKQCQELFKKNELQGLK